MSDFVRMEHIPIKSVTAAASLSMADANFDGVKLYNINKVSPNDRWVTWIIGIVATAAVSVGLFAMWVEASLVTYIAFVIPLISGPCVVVQRKKLQWMPTFREESNRIRDSVNELAMKRVQLEMEVDRMERQVRRLADVEQRFEQLVQREGKRVSDYRQLIRENSKIQAEIKKTHAARELLDLFSVILKTDRNEDNVVTASEAQEFILRVRAFAGRRGKLLDEQMILDAFKHSMNNPTNAHGPASMFNIVQTALSDDFEQPNDVEKQNMNSATEESQPKEEIVEDDFVKLYKIPRVAPTGLVLSDSKDDEGNIAHPITVEDLMARTAMNDNDIFPVTSFVHAPLSASGSNVTMPSMGEDEGTDIVSSILRSFSDLQAT